LDEFPGGDIVGFVLGDNDQMCMGHSVSMDDLSDALGLLQFKDLSADLLGDR
jgi:hypothetical protein